MSNYTDEGGFDGPVAQGAPEADEHMTTARLRLANGSHVTFTTCVEPLTGADVAELETFARLQHQALLQARSVIERAAPNVTMAGRALTADEILRCLEAIEDAIQCGTIK